MYDDYTIAAVVVTYNRKELLVKNIEMLFAQSRSLDAIIIIDNHSTDGTEEHIKDKFQDKLNKIKYYYLQDNIGGAGGFETGVKTAFELHYDYVWLMDDDGRPYDANTLSKLLYQIDKKSLQKKKIILNSLVLSNEHDLSFTFLTDEDTKETVAEKAIDLMIRDRINPFNGTLVSRELIEEIGFPNGSFFIKGDETDFTKRAMKVGAFVATVVDSLYYHPALPKQYTQILWKRIAVTTEAPWKEYYRNRNYTYMVIRDQGRKAAKVLFIKKCILLLFTKRKDKLKCFRMMYKGYVDGCNNNMGIVVEPGA